MVFPLITCNSHIAEGRSNRVECGGKQEGHSPQGGLWRLLSRDGSRGSALSGCISSIVNNCRNRAFIPMEDVIGSYATQSTESAQLSEKTNKSLCCKRP